MNIKSLTLKNVGPFKDLHLDFPMELDSKGHFPVVIITGENGAGKSVILDSLRLLFKGLWGIDRNIIADENDFVMSMTLDIDGTDKTIKADSFKTDGNIFKLDTNDFEYSKSFSNIDEQSKKNYILDYWSPDLAVDKFDISSISILKSDKPLETSFERTFNNSQVNQFICWADYLQGSSNLEEAHKGKVLYKILSDMITDCLVEGQFKYVSRETLKPIVEVRGRELSIEKLSMGNLLLLTHLIRTLYRAYGICVLNNRPIDDIQNVDGVLLIDEIENHLHPKWQKKVLGLIHKYFPKLQLIVTTHSPFVLSSIDNPFVFVCESKEDHSEVHFLSENYSNMPVEDVLNSRVFGVGPFGEKISDLLKERMKAIAEKNKEKVTEIESKLIECNESYFSFYRLSEKLNLDTL